MSCENKTFITLSKRAQQCIICKASSNHFNHSYYFLTKFTPVHYLPVQRNQRDARFIQFIKN
jgi:hypothetical protein